MSRVTQSEPGLPMGKLKTRPPRGPGKEEVLMYHVTCRSPLHVGDIV